MDIHRSYFYYTDKKDDTEVEEAIRAAAEFGDGFWKIYSRLRREGKPWNHKKVYRVYKAMHYEKRSRLKKRLLFISSQKYTSISIQKYTILK
jgi:putative transposase